MRKNVFQNLFWYEKWLENFQKVFNELSQFLYFENLHIYRSTTMFQNMKTSKFWQNSQMLPKKNHTDEFLGTKNIFLQK